MASVEVKNNFNVFVLKINVVFFRVPQVFVDQTPTEWRFGNQAFLRST